MKSIELEISWMEGSAMQLSDLGIDITEDMATTKKVTFYHIDCIFPSDRFGKECTVICIGDQEYLTFKTYEEVKLLIEK